MYRLCSLFAVFITGCALLAAPQANAQPRPDAGHDQPPLLELGAGLPPALAVTPFLGGRAALLADRRIVLVDAAGKLRVLASDASAPPAVSADGRLLLIPARQQLVVNLLVFNGTELRKVASIEGSVGTLRASPDGSLVAFVAPSPGGVAGVWVARLDGGGTTCLTNCALRTGEPWGAAFVPLPRRADDLTFEGDTLRWTDGAARLPGGAP